MPYAQVRGVNLYYEDRGQGQPLLLIAGALGTGQSDFGPQLDALPGEGLRVIAPDARGYGRSRPPAREFPLDFYEQDAQDCAALMDAIGCPSYAVGGWSDGAIIGLLLTLHRPRQVAKLVVWGGNAQVTSEDIEAYEGTRFLSSWSPRMVEVFRSIYSDELQDLWARWCDAQKALYQAGGELCRQRLHLIRCPTLILQGDKDPLVPNFHADLLHQGIVGSRLHIFPDGKHNIHQAYAQEFNRLVIEFLQA
ncbi:MAG TPA: alpha/beta hydrolase [Candidatus Binatia bacterium]|nr:alpha/beta hydrolase [Candidatus Binatia bacterium]